MTGTLGDPTEPVVDLAENQRHRLFSSERRRTTVDVLAERSAPVSLGDLAAAVAAREAGEDPAPSETVDRVSIDLHHAHLPVLDELGVVDYDPARNRIEAHSVRSPA